MFISISSAYRGAFEKKLAITRAWVFLSHCHHNSETITAYQLIHPFKTTFNFFMFFLILSWVFTNFWIEDLIISSCYDFHLPKTTETKLRSPLQQNVLHRCRLRCLLVMTIQFPKTFQEHLLNILHLWCVFLVEFKADINMKTTW